MSLKERCSNMTQANRYIGNIIKRRNNEEIIEDKIIKELVKSQQTAQKLNVELLGLLGGGARSRIFIRGQSFIL